MRAEEFLVEFSVANDDIHWLAKHASDKLKKAIVSTFHKLKSAGKKRKTKASDEISSQDPPSLGRKKKDPRLAKPIDEDSAELKDLFSEQNFFNYLKTMQQSSPSEFHIIMAKVWSGQISVRAKELFKKKKLPLDATVHFDHIIIDAGGTFENKLKFLDKLIDNGPIDPSGIRTGGLGNFNDIMKYDNEIYQEIKRPIMNWTPKIGSTVSGKGEMFVILFTDDATKATVGDVDIDGATAEVKAYEARLIGHKGYGSTIGTFKEYVAKLHALFPDRKLPEDPNWYNWNYKGLSELSKLFSEAARAGKGDKIKPIIDWTLQSLYVDSTPEQRDKIVDVIAPDGSFDVDEFIRQWMLFQFDYYQMTEDFDGILFVNPVSFDFLYVSDTDEFADHYEKFRVQPTFSWKDKQSIVIKISLK